VSRTDDVRPTPAPEGPASERLAVDVMIPTFNEADHIADVVANASALGRVYVLDSCSTDGTQELARKAGATVVEHKFINYSDQKNWGLDNLPFTGEWVFILDADERITPTLLREIHDRVRTRTVDGYFVNRMNILMGQTIRHGGFYPSWNLRLFRRGRARYENRSVHEHMMCAGPTDYLRHEMIHIRRETISQYLAKHIRYADMESTEWVRNRLKVGQVDPVNTLFKDLLLYRQWLRREVWPLVPCRPLLRFCYIYFFRLGFLDGRAGWRLAMLMGCYEYMISLLYTDKLRVARENLRKAGTPAAAAPAASVAAPGASSRPVG
jgi:glycosyltransferase involved in cell wall biosynthesis